jgi:hypothetical protein
MSERLPVVFLVDVDNTLLDNDHIQNDLQRDMCSSTFTRRRLWPMSSDATRRCTT